MNVIETALCGVARSSTARCARAHHLEVERIELGRVVQPDHSDAVLDLQLHVAVEEQRCTAHVAGGMAKARRPCCD